MPNTNYQTIHQMGTAVNDIVKQATGRDDVQNIDMDFVTVARNHCAVHEEYSGSVVSFEAQTETPMGLIVQIAPVQDLHGQNSPYPPGGGKNILPTAGLTQGTASSTTFSNTTQRTFTIGTYVYGISANNYCLPSNVTGISVTDNRVAFTTSASAYGVSIPLTGLTVGETYTISGTATNGRFGLSFYQQDGTFISGTGGSAGTTSYYAIVPENTYYTLAVIFAIENDIETVVTNIQLEKSNTASSFAPYSNICPITGWTGANITQAGGNIYTTENSIDGAYIQPDGTIATNADFLYTDLIDVTKGSIIYASMTNPGNIARYTRVHGYDESGNWIEQINATQIQINSTAEYSFDIPEGVKYIRISIAKSLTNISFELGRIYSVSFPDSAGTVYGGTLIVNKDGTGQLVVDRAYNLLNDETLWKETTGTTDFYYDQYFSNRKLYSDSYQGLMCSYIRVSTSGSDTARWKSTASYVFGIKSTKVTLQDIKSDAVSGNIAICYSLATPVTYNLTNLDQIKTLIGPNNVWADTGDITVQFTDIVED